jgi:hypothetical protein
LATDGKAEASADFDAELDDDSDAGSSTAYLSEYRKMFGKAAQSLDNTTRLFNETSTRLEDLSGKVEKIKRPAKSKKH